MWRWDLWRIQGSAFASEDPVALRRAGRELDADIKLGKATYGQNIHDHFVTSGPWSMWKGIKSITGFKTVCSGTHHGVDIFNISLSLWLWSIVFPVPKDPAEKAMSNYCLVAFTPLIMKWLERLLLATFMSQLTSVWVHSSMHTGRTTLLSCMCQPALSELWLYLIPSFHRH